MTVAIINYGMGNVASVEKAVNYLGHNAIITNDAFEISEADCIVLPGVGAFAQGMENLIKYGLVEILNKEVNINKKPFLGICLGMQLLASKGFEPFETSGLGWVDGIVQKMEEPNKSIPHLGWNELKSNSSSFLKEFNDVDFYFIHSYHFDVSNSEEVAGTVEYGKNYVAAIKKDNIFATQFHPEKSQVAGLEVMKLFFNTYVKN